MSNVWNDLRYAIRGLRAAPGFTLVALATLALGIGATSAIFTVVNAVLLRPLPFREPSRLVTISSLPFVSMPDSEYAAYRAQNRTFEEIAGMKGTVAAMLGAGEPANVRGRSVSASFWNTLGVAPLIGRVFGESETDAVVLSHALWAKQFQSRQDALGKVVQLNGKPFRVTGVMPAEFSFTTNPMAEPELWTPMELELKGQHNISLQAIGRLRPGATMQQAANDLSALRRQMGGRFSQRAIAVASLEEAIVGKTRKSLWVLLGAVGMLLLIACVNVANLLVARGARREQEFATRAALGASRWRLVRQTLVESITLSFAGGALGLLVALWGQSALAAAGGVYRLPRLAEVHIDSWVLGFTILLTIITGVLFGLAPAAQSSKVNLGDAIRRASARSGGGRVRGALVVVEIALAMVLLAGAGLLIRSFVRLRSVPTGFEAQSVLAMSVDLPSNAYSDTAKMRAFHDGMMERLASLPGVTAHAAVNWLPFGGMGIAGDFYTPDDPKKSRGGVLKPSVTPDYFRAIGIRVLEGRAFNDRDVAGAEPVAIVGARVASLLWPGQNAIGQRVSLNDNSRPEDWLTVVGVVDDVKQEQLSKEAVHAIYVPLAQTKNTFFLSMMSYIVRTDGDPRLAPSLMRQQLKAVDPNQPIRQIATMNQLISDSTAEPRFQSRMLGAFAGAALLLAMVGIYGVMAFAVAARTREIGVRIALGAAPGDVFRLVLGRSALLVGVGLILGLGGAFAATRVLRDFLFEVTPTDPMVFAAGSALLALVAFAAAYLPARSATRVDPMIALRQE
jgi:putative ABC transport system permease protein